ncbi:flagellar biosynthesis protein FlhB [Thermosediminibacter oceani]|uniref:Flagellar biosynthetic protein FlhB n=1 Tax=Thermosediminibacter oceani (strain ATCC BAA-1034 / DSM 16646 / JW/IW-1228P) TaxID=555079 RepID=D9S3A0_THEOJ|nr:flagellar biosynthesis protein FlhB [Thermosediminibacter oceani]ADL07877.1 flagellar biosynthetic protein FlhB [Thermosediminibacter oceani DSM 16646]
MNLQLFSQEKTEKATPRRRQKARERGQVFSSRELNSALILLASFVLLKIFGIYIFENTGSFLRQFFIENLIRQDLSISDIYGIFYSSIVFVLKSTAPVAVGIVLVGLLVNFLQVGFVFSLEPISPKLDRINPVEGAKRIFSKRSLIELVKALVKIILIIYIFYGGFVEIKDTVALMLDMSFTESLGYFTSMMFRLGLKVGIALLVLSVLDYGYQWYEYEKSLMMSKEDVKEELKEVEGNPQIKSRIRQVQRQMSRRRMMQEVKKADVVITNPTHIAIALGYDASVHAAPVVLAKGTGAIAEKIKEIAEREDIPIVENKPLAQTLFKSVEVGDIIPEEFYNAVAEILAFVYSLKGRRV